MTWTFKMVGCRRAYAAARQLVLAAEMTASAALINDEPAVWQSF
jgi:hypothetical protein